MRDKLKLSWWLAAELFRRHPGCPLIELARSSNSQRTRSGGNSLAL
jgi:hypothetical protein